MPEFQGKKYPYTSAGYRSMMKDRKAAGAVDMKKGGRSQKFRKGGVKKTRKKKIGGLNELIERYLGAFKRME